MTPQPSDRSPILQLESDIARSVYRIAPEREDELAAEVQAHNISLVITDDRGLSIRVDPCTGDITVPIAALEYVWACAHAFLVFYDDYGAAQRRGDNRFTITQSARGQAAVDLFNWAIENMETSGVDRWPDELPRPEKSPEHKSDVHIANETFLCAMAWILHHEIAHKRLNHPPHITPTALMEEKAADREATAWILDRADDAQVRRKRTLGVVVAILTIQAAEVTGRTGHGAAGTHPPTPQRLADCLYEYQLDDDDEVLAVAAANLQILLAQRGIAEIDLEQASFDALLSEFLIALSRSK